MAAYVNNGCPQNFIPGFNKGLIPVENRHHGKVNTFKGAVAKLCTRGQNCPTQKDGQQCMCPIGDPSSPSFTTRKRSSSEPSLADKRLNKDALQQEVPQITNYRRLTSEELNQMLKKQRPRAFTCFRSNGTNLQQLWGDEVPNTWGCHIPSRIEGDSRLSGGQSSTSLEESVITEGFDSDGSNTHNTELIKSSTLKSRLKSALKGGNVLKNVFKSRRSGSELSGASSVVELRGKFIKTNTSPKEQRRNQCSALQARKMSYSVENVYDVNDNNMTENKAARRKISRSHPNLILRSFMETLRSPESDQDENEMWKRDDDMKDDVRHLEEKEAEFNESTQGCFIRNDECITDKNNTELIHDENREGNNEIITTKLCRNERVQSWLKQHYNDNNNDSSGTDSSCSTPERNRRRKNGTASPSNGRIRYNGIVTLDLTKPSSTTTSL